MIGGANNLIFNYHQPSLFSLERAKSNCKINWCSKLKKLGVFDTNRVRGRGWHWIEINGRKMPICYTGEQLIINRQQFKLDALGDRNEIWINKPEIDWGNPNEKPDNDFARKVYEGIQNVLFATHTDAMLMLGWMLLAPLCGLLNVRPGMWLLGESQEAKDTFINYFLHKLLGKTLLRHFTGISEAKVRRELMNDAVAILIDEYEAEIEGERINQKKYYEAVQNFNQYIGTNFGKS